MIGALEISDSSIKSWIPKILIEYSGVYHFGEGESESELLLFYAGDKIISQIKEGYWKGTGFWVWSYKNLTNIEISKSGLFSSDQYSGQFVSYFDNDSLYKGLKINNPWTEWLDDDVYEVGIRMDGVILDRFPGKYPEASVYQLDKEKLRKLTKQELKIMRNEIFARYGYKFKPKGKMDKYFQEQNWYHWQHDNVNDFLTDLEKENIKLIQQIENE